MFRAWLADARRVRQPVTPGRAMAIGRCVTGGLRTHSHCNNRPAGDKQGSERTQSLIKDRGKVRSYNRERQSMGIGGITPVQKLQLIA